MFINVTLKMKRELVMFLIAAFYTNQLVFSKPNLGNNWNTFKILHRKQFATLEEEILRRNIFENKMVMIEQHNERFRKGLETYEVGMNKFTDYTEEELLHILKVPIHEEAGSCFKFPSPINLPEYFDWRDEGMVTPVKTQSGCGSCWAFAATGTIEAHYKIYHNVTLSLSEQQLIDCVPEATGCGGGWMVDAYLYISKNGGINYSGNYPYEDQDSICRYSDSKPKVAIKGYKILDVVDEEMLRYVVTTTGPVSVAINGEGNFVDYKRGVYYNPLCLKDKFTHAGVIVGYGTENGQDYWLMKNSWGSQWGSDGYIKMARNRNNHCGIASKASYPVV